MKEKFIHCIDEKIKDKLIEQGFELINNQIINSNKTWIFQNNSKIIFNKDFINKVKFTNKMYF